ncbi:SusC/RagA family TonB-linked outer membrane protein [Roseivirga pacifica]|uniref:SusC/RagA family TonB-linked outer membrane protein n=1 Tax=Roseivirga pacifica TaxID=1267423 RepID=UPI00209487A5|nr:SusC/RagA family TonB-linked outer membrane protein [Roseivirga pacifica]MCO6358657.1 SusC/RagA family TonB-linked outer membrane protein [Roseivirga pacifica]MCO6365707.1 SusC/RagA family TonB-linked outer membrane protein [Roseivirga pacifica]MCO6371563.1 SusC/RagA family TonB-linked outer membrane protein [Roseivirga pacifica]MCO6376326.1 SusC/RagA family TonB-linked outer membrane protein [Roseivirga pacifica]MCO6378941.1 SusC/RagA family TonB-linked outer membrane protein [Roseivirga p
MKRNLLTCFMLAFFLIASSAVAQQRTISGKVTGADDGLPLPGVTILIKGTGTGQSTDMDGNYTMNVESGSTLVFSFLGYITQEVVINNQTVLNIAMQPDVQSLGEVVVTGYGESTKRSYTGTAATVKKEDIEAKNFSNVSQALAGEVSGVTVINTSGQPGTTSTIRIRGFGSVNGNRNPLYVVDGVPFSGSINSINPADIESTTVLKDATSTALYGARGANGVILITTKSGKANESNIEVDIKTGINDQMLPRQSVLTSPEEYIGLTWESLYNRGVATGEADPVAFANSTLFGGGGISAHYNMWNVADGGELIDPATGTVRPGVTRKYNPERWADYGIQSSTRTEANIRISGGSKDTKYFTSFGYLDDVGAIINSDYERYSTRLNIQSNVKEWLTTSVNLGYAYSENQTNGQSSDSGSIFWFSDNIPSIYPLFLRDDEGNIVPDPVFGGNQYDYGDQGRGFGALTNSIADAHYDRNGNKRHELNGNFTIDAQITDVLSFQSKYGAQFYANRQTSLRNPFYGSGASQGGSMFRNDTELFVQNWLNMLTYQNDFGDHSLEILGAHESNSYDQTIFTANKQKAVLPYLDEFDNYVIVSSPPSSYKNSSRLESYFAQGNYSYLNKYYLSASVRRDGSSRFANNKWDTFWSVGASWIASDEDFLTLDFVDFLKFKASYGLTGEQAGVGLFPGYNTFNVSNLNDEISISERNIGNPDLTWETSKQFQIGTEFTLFNNFIDGSVDYFIKNTTNLLFDRRVGPSVGYALQTVNDGALRNSGLEFDLTAHLIKKNDFNLDFAVNGAFLNNELTKMPIDPATGEEKVLDIAGSYGRTVGRSLFDYYMREWAGVNPDDGTAMWNLYYDDANGNGAFDDGEGIESLYEYKKENPNATILKTTTGTYANATQKFIDKSSVPTVNGAFRLSASYKGFTFGAQFIYMLGGYAYDGSYAGLMHNRTAGNNNWHTDIRDRWQQPGDVTDVPRLSDNYDTNVNSTSTRFLTKKNYLGLNNIRIGYTLPTNWVSRAGMKSANVSLSADNLMILSARQGFNPSTSESGSSSTYNYAPLTTFTLGLRVKF